MSAKNYTYREMAEVLGRTEPAVKRHCMDQDPPIRGRQRQRWTPAQKKMVAEMMDRTVDYLADRLGRSTSAVIHAAMHELTTRSKRDRARQWADKVRVA